MQNTYQEKIDDLEVTNSGEKRKLEGGIKFKIKSEFQPNGDQPEAIKKLLKNLKENKQEQVLLGVTGSGNLDYAEITENLKTIRNKINVPLVTGFGIKTTEHVKQFKNFTDGIVIGSSIVDILSKPNPITTLENYISPIIKEIKE